MKLIREDIQEIKCIKEAGSKGEKNYYVQGVFMQAEAQNRNGRIYPLHVLQKEVRRFNEEVVKSGRALGELGHPEGPTINLERVSHQIKELVEDGDNIVGKAKILETPYGKIVKSFLDEGIKLGVSSRGMGSLVPLKGGIHEVQDDFYLCTVDIVADPSAPDAFVNGMMEGKEFVWENGIIKEMSIEQYKERIKRAKSRELEAKKVEVFADFMKKLTGN